MILFAGLPWRWLRYAIALALISLAAASASAAVSVVPGSPNTRSGMPAVDKYGVSFDVEAAEGDVRYRWTPDVAGDGGGTIKASLGGAATLNLRYRPMWTGVAKRISSTLRVAGRDILLTDVFDVGGERTTLSIRGHIVGGSLLLEVAADRATLSKFIVTPPQAADGQRFSFLYNPIDIEYSKLTGGFATAFFDWTYSEATQIDPDGASYHLKTDGRRNTLRERLIFTVSRTVASVFPNAASQRSRYYDRVAGRTFIDVSVTMPFAEIEQKLQGLIEAGLSNCVLIIHAWQRLGYDNGFPDVLPANAYLGGGEILQRIGQLARSAKCEFALHQNYIDSYPNALKFEKNDIALDATGAMQAGWLNSAVGQASYSVRPRLLPILARKFAPDIKSTLGTTASFIDVNTSFRPWDRADMDAREPEGGKFSAFFKGSKKMFEVLQDVEQGPVFGEGHNHFYWTGAVDGVEAQPTIGYRGDYRNAPLWVDFNLSKIAPFQLNFGMGFYGRHSPATAQSSDPMTVPENRDIYRTQQIAFGHLPYRAETLWGEPRLFVQEEALAGPVARAYAGVAAKEIRYKLGTRWVPIETALPVGAGRSVRIRYDNNLVVTANTADSILADDRGVALPKGGWSATGAGIDARSAIVRGERRDFARSRESIYADPRGAPGNWSGTGGASTLTDFGLLRTNAQSWLRCEGGQWTLRAFATRGNADIEVREDILLAPGSLRAEGDVTAKPVKGTPGYWRVRLTSGLRYTTDRKCGA